MIFSASTGVIPYCYLCYDQVPAVFACERKTFFVDPFDKISVADIRSFKGDSFVFQVFFKPCIAHDRDCCGVVSQLAFFAQKFCDYSDDFVTVDNASELVNSEPLGCSFLAFLR